MKKVLQGVKDGRMLRGIMIGIAICVIIGMIGSAVCSSVLLNEIIEWKSVHIYTWIILALSSLLGTVVAEKIAGERYAVVAGLVFGLYMLILSTITILFFDGVFNHAFGNVIAVLVGTVVACAICIRSGSRERGKKRRFR